MTPPKYFSYFSFCVFYHSYLFTFLKNPHLRIWSSILEGEKGERQRDIHVKEKHHSVASCTRPKPGMDPAARYMPWPGIDPANFWLRDDTPSRSTTGHYSLTFGIASTKTKIETLKTSFIQRLFISYVWLAQNTMVNKIDIVSTCLQDLIQQLNVKNSDHDRLRKTAQGSWKDFTATLRRAVNPKLLPWDWQASGRCTAPFLHQTFNERRLYASH